MLMLDRHIGQAIYLLQHGRITHVLIVQARAQGRLRLSVLDIDHLRTDVHEIQSHTPTVIAETDNGPVSVRYASSHHDRGPRLGLDAPITVDIVRDDVVIKPRSKCGDAA